MNRMVKRLMVVLLSVFMFLGTVTTPVQAKDSTSGTNGWGSWWGWWWPVQPTEPDPEPAEEPVVEEEEPVETEEPVIEEEQEEETPIVEEEAPVVEEAPAEEPVIEETEIAYPEFSLTSDEIEGTTVTVVSPEGALPEGTTMEVVPVNLDAVQTAVDKAADVTGTVVAAVDITFRNVNGEVIEPLAPITVTMTSEEIAKAENPQVVHVDTTAEEIEAADVEAEAVDAEAEADAVVFDAEHFSVYAVVEPGDEGNEARATVNFYGENTDTPVATFYVKNSDELLGTGERDNTKSYIEDIVFDPGVGTLTEGKIFRGWAIGNEYNEDTEPMDIQAVRQYLANLSIKEGDVVNIYAMIFKIITVSYLGEGNVSLGSESLVLTASQDSISYTVNMAYTPSSSYQDFEGWSVSSGSSNIQGYVANTIYKNGTELTISGDVTFSVEAPLGHWLVFDEVEKGATYIAPQFVKQGENTVAPTIEMQLSGYTFGGWYTDKNYTTPFTFGNTLTDNITVYAKWNAKEKANYTVIIWKQNVNDAKDAADSAKKYDFAESITLEGTVGNTINTVTEAGTGNGRYARVNNVNKRYPGFHLRTYDTNVTIDTKGNSIVNVYYDRNLITLTFQYIQNNRWQTQATMTGLYGSTLSSNGYTWPTNRWWYDDYDGDYWNGYYGSGTRTTFLDAFKLADDGDSQTFYGFSGSGSRTVHFLKKDANGSYTEANTVSVSNGTFYISDKYNGYKAVSYSTNNSTWTTLGDKNSQGYYGSVSNYTNLYIRFDPLLYNILYKDGVYVDGSNNPVEGYSNRGQLHEVTGIPFESNISSYNKDGANYYAPTFSGFVFDGWYIDDQCTHAYTFNTMPEGIIVYAKWVQTQYRVFLHPNAGTDTTLDWGSDSQGMNFRVSLGGKVSAPTGLRQEYEMVGWYLDEGCTQVFNADAYVLNDTTVTTPYDKAVDMTDPMDKWGIIGANPYNSDARENRHWITKKLDLYAKWRAILIGANGIGITYDANGGTNAPSDTLLYLDQAGAIAQAASTAPEGKQFLYWVVQRWDETAQKYVDTDELVYPADTFTVRKAYTKTVENEGSTVEKPSFTYTMQLRAEYGDREVDKSTYINWYRNYDEKDTVQDGVLHHDADKQINEAVDIYTLTTGIPVRTGYKFLGWARDKEFEIDESGKPEGEAITYHENPELYLIWVEADGDTGAHYETTDGLTVTQVAADESLPYQAFYAVWEYVGVFYIYHSSDATVDIVDMANDLTKEGTYDLTSTVKDNYLYGGYFESYFNVTDEQAIAAAKAGEAVDTTHYTGAALYEKVSGRTVRYWTKSKAIKANGTTLAPVADTVYYLREIPTAYLGLRAQAVYDWSNGNKIDNVYLITTVDNNIYTEAGFKIVVLSGDKKASLYASYSLQSRGSNTVTKITAADLNNIGGYVGVWDGTSELISKNLKFTVEPYWITMDGIRVEDTHTPRKFDMGDMTFGTKTGMHEIFGE